MKDPKIQTKVVHSKSKLAWNVVGVKLGGKHKIARVPYEPCEDEIILERWKQEAYEHAIFISHCFNTSTSILEKEEIGSIKMKEINLAFGTGYYEFFEKSVSSPITVEKPVLKMMDGFKCSLLFDGVKRSFKEQKPAGEWFEEASIEKWLNEDETNPQFIYKRYSHTMGCVVFLTKKENDKTLFRFGGFCNMSQIDLLIRQEANNLIFHEKLEKVL